MTLDSSSLSSGDPGNRGAIWLDSGETASEGRQSRGALTLTRSTLEGNTIVVQSAAAQTIIDSQLTAPKGLIHLEAGRSAVPQSAVNLRIAKSMFDVGVHALADLRRPVQSSIDFNGVTINLPVPTPSIGLYATGSIDVSSETQLLASQLLGPIRKAYPFLQQADIKLDDTSGVVVIDANQSVRVRNSELRADASDNLAGNLFLRSQDGRRSAGVMIDRSTLSASGGAISGDIRISSSAGLNVHASRLVATGQFALEDADRPGHPTWQKAFSGGEITLTNSSPSRAIRILNSRLYAQQAASMTVLSDRSLAGDRRFGFGLSALDSNDGPASIGGVVSVVSAGGIKVKGAKSLISVDSQQRSRGDLGHFGGVIRMVSTQHQPLVISQGAQLSARAGPALDPLSKPVSWGGEINLWSGGHLLLDRASLDAQTLGTRIGSPQAPLALAHPSVSRRHQGRIYLAARGDLRLHRSSSLATHPDVLGTDGPAVPPQVSLFSASKIRSDASDYHAACPGGCAAIVDVKTLRNQREPRLWGRSRRGDVYLLKPGSIDRDLALDGGVDDPLGFGEQVRSNFWRDRVVGVFTEGRSPVLIKGDLFGRSLTVYPLDVAETIVDRQARDSAVGGLQKVLLNRPRHVPSVAPIPVLSLSSAVASIGPALPLLEPGQSMGKQDALALLQVSESQAALSLNKELGMPPLSTARFSVPRLQNSLRASMVKPRSERGGSRLPAYVPAMIRINASTLPDGERLQINQILVPPTGEIVAWSRLVSWAEFKAAVLAHRRQTMEPTSAAQGGRQHERLTQMLLGPALPELKRHGVTALVLSLDRPLQAIPFAALPLEGRVLADTFSMAVTPALLLTDLGPRDDDRRTGGTLLAGAEQFGEGLAPLPMVQQELRAIGRLQSRPELLLNEAFTTATLIKRLQQDSLTALHLATHADFSAGRLNGGELFTASGKLAMPQFGQSLRARSRPLDFVFLSACRSALGDELSELGISGLALLAGATSALGTLWYVDNIASTAFAIQFYRLLRQGLSKDVALREVQQSFRQGLVRLHANRIIAPDGAVLVDGISDADRWRLVDGLKHPYYWAGYVLSGSPW
ncbi:MAG: CHAT domain-containing protein [Prochlorococcaceae cyanobacterium]